MQGNYLESVIRQLEFYKELGEKTISRLDDRQLFFQFSEESNSLAILVKHLWGNMLSRWTDFLNTDGEKEWRRRDTEFENDIQSREDLMHKWSEGWKCLLDALGALQQNDLDRIVYIRNQGHTVTEAINRSLSHYCYHVGQIVFIGKMFCGGNWESLTIPKGNSEQYNKEKFAREKRRQHFTDDFRSEPQ